MIMQAQTSTVREPLRWFAAGAVAALVAAAVLAGIALAVVIPSTQLGGAPAVGSGPSIVQEGYRDQRAGEIGAGGVNVSGLNGSTLTDHRRGEIGAASGPAAPPQTLGDHRQGEINEGR